MKLIIETTVPDGATHYEAVNTDPNATIIHWWKIKKDSIEYYARFWVDHLDIWESGWITTDTELSKNRKFAPISIMDELEK